MEPPDVLAPAAPLRPSVRRADSPFSHECCACGRCCHDKRIVVNPYEVARLAANRGISTTAFIQRYTEAGVALAVREDGACVFLTKRGCDVHPDRPLVCRLYPLGVVGMEDGSDVYVEMEPQKGCEAVTGETGTVATYLEGQGVGPYRAAGRVYREALSRLVVRLAEGEGAAWASGAIAGAPVSVADPAILDVDLALARAARAGLTIPQDLEGRVRLHAQLIAGAPVPRADRPGGGPGPGAVRPTARRRDGGTA